MKRLLFVVAILIAALSVIAAVNRPKADAAVEVNVTLTEYKMTMSRSNLPAGVPIKFNFIQQGTVIHEAVLEKAGADDVPIEIAGKAVEEENIEPATTRSVVWTISEPGDYQLACHLPSHFENGMKVTFHVVSGGVLMATLADMASWIAVGAAVIILAIIALVIGMRRRAAMQG